MPREISIDEMVDQLFNNGANELVDEIAEERTFIVNTLREWINDDSLWQDCLDKKENRKMFIQWLQELTLQELQTNTLIELATIEQGEE